MRSASKRVLDWHQKKSMHVALGFKLTEADSSSSLEQPCSRSPATHSNSQACVWERGRMCVGKRESARKKERETHTERQRHREWESVCEWEWERKSRKKKIERHRERKKERANVLQFLVSDSLIQTNHYEFYFWRKRMRMCACGSGGGGARDWVTLISCFLLSTKLFPNSSLNWTLNVHTIINWSVIGLKKSGHIWTREGKRATWFSWGSERRGQPHLQFPANHNYYEHYYQQQLQLTLTM